MIGILSNRILHSFKFICVFFNYCKYGWFKWSSFIFHLSLWLFKTSIKLTNYYDWKSENFILISFINTILMISNLSFLLLTSRTYFKIAIIVIFFYFSLPPFLKFFLFYHYHYIYLFYFLNIFFFHFKLYLLLDSCFIFSSFSLRYSSTFLSNLLPLPFLCFSIGLKNILS